MLPSVTKLLAFCVLLLQPAWASAQYKIEGLAGGANFTGISLNGSATIPLSASGVHALEPKLGFGSLFFYFDKPRPILHFGANYLYKHTFGIGSDVGFFGAFRNSYNNFRDPFGDDLYFIVYPNVNYTYTFKSDWFIKISGGAYFAFSRDGFNANNREQIQFLGDVIPGAGISFGYRFPFRTKPAG